MPGPFIPDPTPEWLKPENASVTDSALTRAMRMIGHLIGADNPTAQVLGLMTTSVPSVGPGGGIAGALERLMEKAAPIKAYHGSPHDFERFSMEKIGTGEGAQAYGHGLYFAENPGVAKSYQDSLVKPLIGGVPADQAYQSEPKTIYDMLRKLRETNPSANFDDASRAWQIQHPRSQVIANVASYGSEAQRFITDPKAKELYQSMVKSGEIQMPKGRMYEVAIHADPETFLDWDKPLSQQPAHIQRAVRQAIEIPQITIVDKGEGYRAGSRYVLKDQHGVPQGATNTPEMALQLKREIEDMTGAQVHSQLWNEADAPINYGRQKEIASERLKQAGIPGIKYLDQGSRAAGEGSRNYVVFDDKLVEILKKYGLAVPVIEGLRQQASQQQGVLHRDQLPQAVTQ